MPYPKPNARRRAYRPKTTCGCKTCKIRKIKCDESKPHCHRCTSTGRKCDGYASAIPSSAPPMNRIGRTTGLFSRVESTGLLCRTDFSSARPAMTHVLTGQPELENDHTVHTKRITLRKPAGKRASTREISCTISSLGLHFELSSPEERSSFHFYETYASRELPGFFTSTFWTRELLIAARYFPAIRHAIVAVGAMYRRYIAGYVTSESTSKVSFSFEEHRRDSVEIQSCYGYDEILAENDLKFALRQSNRAIREIVSHESTAGSRVDKVLVLTLCILFNCMACLQGRYQEARQHLRSGLKLLREIDKEMEEEMPSCSAVIEKVEHPVRIRSLRIILIGLDLQARGLMRNHVERQDWEQPLKHGMNMSKFDHNDLGGLDLEDAQLHLSSTLNAFMAWFQSLEQPGPSVSDSDMVPITQKFYKLKSQAEEGARLLESVLSRSEEATANVAGYKSASTALRLLHAAVDLSVKAFEVRRLENSIEEEAEIFDQSNPFKGMMEMLEDLLGPGSEALSSSKSECFPHPTNKQPVFSFNSGILFTLWWIFQQTLSTPHRMKAISMMLMYPRREGFWDGLIAGKIAWEAVRLEQQSVRDELGVSGGSGQLVVPEHLRIRNIDIEYLGTTGAKVEYRNVRTVKQGGSGWERIMNWGP
ncbi:unnamed protein product [Periconia digitata]|uniref:Zn(2)-C6 fungal-type domain-containing protein n=1 Tax=Periconia digitata TaxID=1303443 RepID=A0A9W4XSJ7_9PLEO|nr:unnamed protein product [Periconia digitata]